MSTRPKVILKFAMSQDGFIGNPNKQVWLTNPISKRLVHKWRSEIDAIMVGTQTALLDNPKLTNRLYFGTSPLRLILDRQLRLPKTLSIYDDSVNTYIITEKSVDQDSFKRTRYLQFNFDETLIPNCLEWLFQNGQNLIMIEGGAQLLNSFIGLNLWDEARVFSTSTILNEGIKAPKLLMDPQHQYQIGSDYLSIYHNFKVK